MNQDTLKFANLPPSPTLRRRKEGVGFSCDQQRLARTLARMAGAEDGIRDAPLQVHDGGQQGLLLHPIGGGAAQVCLLRRLRNIL